MERRALLIGNWEYADKDDRLKPLKGPEHDVEVLRDALTHDEYGLFEPDEVTTHTNLTKPQLDIEIKRFINDAPAKSRLLFYFSGHGEPMSGRQLGLVAVELESSLGDVYMFDTRLLKDWIDDSLATSAVIVLDCCYAGLVDMKGSEITDDVIDATFPDAAMNEDGEGVAALCSSGNRPAKDATEEGQPSLFTRALVDILVDPEQLGTDGLLTIDDAWQGLAALKPRPKRKLNHLGSLALAQRPAAPAAVEELKRWTDKPWRTIDVTFSKDQVTAEIEGITKTLRRDLSSFDKPRREAIRRLTQLSDSVAQRADSAGEEAVPNLCHRAWDCVGTNLLESVIPEGLYDHIERFAGDELNTVLRLSFDEDSKLEGYPWEYLGDPQFGRTLGLRPEVLIERVSPKQTSPPAPSPAKTINVFSALDGALGKAVETLATRVHHDLSSLAMLTSTHGEDATWSQFRDSLIKAPRILTLAAPLVRHGHGKVDIGFRNGTGTGYETRKADDVLDEIVTHRQRFDLLVIETFASEHGTDSYRALVDLGRLFAERDLGPVLFSCHSTAYASTLAGNPTHSFLYLVLQAIVAGKALDASIRWAKQEALSLGNDEMKMSFGVPGFYSGIDTRIAARPLASSMSLRSPEATTKQ